MDRMTPDEGIQLALDGLLGDRLALLAGAGLSMAPPSRLPSAATIAQHAKNKYDATHGGGRPPLPPGIEDQAEFFFQRGELNSVYFRTLIDQHAFAVQPNPGHYAAADLLLVRALQLVVTTNVDTLIENAGQQIFGQVGVGLDGHQMAALLPDSSKMLKIHGCRTVDSPNMVWAPGQLAAPPVDRRIATSTTWLNANLLDRDLLIVGFWTDWDYLNRILESTLGIVEPARVIVVDPADPATFEAKAPHLFGLGRRAKTAFKHVQMSGSDFLENLRREFSRSFVRRVLHLGATDFKDQKAADPDARWLEPASHDNTVLWNIRRDLEGCVPNEPSTHRQPLNEPNIGLTLLQLQAAGAVLDDQYWLLAGKRIRVLRAANKALHKVEGDFDRETPPIIAPDITIAVGSESTALPSSIVRGGTTATIARGSKSRWLTRQDAVTELAL